MDSARSVCPACAGAPVTVATIATAATASATTAAVATVSVIAVVAPITAGGFSTAWANQLSATGVWLALPSTVARGFAC